MDPSPTPRRDDQRAPRFFPFYYGWIVVAIGTLGILMSVPGQTMGISVFTDSLIDAFGITRNQLSFAYMGGTLASSLLLPWAGRLLDLWGARRMVVLATTGLIVSLVILIYGSHLADRLAPLLPNSDSTFLPVRIAEMIPDGLAGLTVATIAFMGVRHFGQGQMTMIARTMIGRWFESYRGIAFAISGAFVAFGFGVAPLILSRLIDACGWRGAILILILAEVVMMGLGLAFYRTGAIACGVPMEDGMKPRSRSDNRKVRDWELSEVRRCSTFWLFCMGITLYGAIFTAIVFHLQAVCAARGVNPDNAYSLFLPMAMVSATAEMIGSWLSDRYSVRYHLLLMQVSLSIGTLGFLFLGTTGGNTMIVLGLGITGGLFATINGVAWPKLFGTKHLGAIAGLNTGWVVFGCAFSPLLFSLSFSAFGSYQVAISVSAALPIIIFVWALFHRHKDRHEDRPPNEEVQRSA